MKKMKKLFAVILSLAMVLGMSMTAFATESNEVPDGTQKIAGTVTNVEKDLTVTAYQIVKGDYEDGVGLKGYKAVDNDNIKIAKPTAPTDSEITKIAADINSGKLSGLESVTLSQYVKTGVNEANEELGTYSSKDDSEKLTAGYWLVLVRGSSKEVYNPMLIGVYYNVSGSDSGMNSEEVNANSNWTLQTTGAYAKSSEVTITKTEDVQTQDLGKTVNYTLTTKVPDYSAEYDSVTFSITDKMVGLEYKKGSMKVNDVVVSENTDDYELTENNDGFTLSYKKDWIMKNGGLDLTITYSAILTGDAVNADSHYNDVTLTYTNKPGETTNKTDHKDVYTFDIDGVVTTNLLRKVQPGETTDTVKPLKDAEFTLYMDKECTQQYTNSKHEEGKPTAKSDEYGKLHITGLNAGTYYLKETKAPSGFSVTDKVIKIEIPKDEIVFDADGKLQSWKVYITLDGKRVENGFTVTNGEAKADTDVTENNDKNVMTDVMNTKLSELPSTGGIGTTIFTIGGCTIMIIAAALFFASRRKSAK